MMQEYFNLGHAESVPERDFDKPESDVFYFSLHIVYKESSTTTKVRAVFDASAKTASGVSLNDQLQVGPTVHPPLVHVQCTPLIPFQKDCCHNRCQQNVISN